MNLKKPKYLLPKLSDLPMIPYIVILLLIIGCFIQFDCNSRSFKTNKRAQECFLLLTIILTAYAALSYRVGCDTNRYYENFHNFPTLKNLSISNLWDFGLEPLWVLLNTFVRTFSNSFYPIYAFCIIIINLQIFRLIKQYCNLPFLAILLYYSIMYLNLNFEMIRQDYAMIFYFWGIFALLKGRTSEFLLKAFPSIFFHKSTLLIYLITIVVYNLNYKGIYNWILIGMFICSTALKSLLPQLSMILNLTIFDPTSNINGYLEGTARSDNFSLISLITSFIGGMIIPLLIINLDKGQSHKVLKKLLFGYLIIMSIYPISPIIYRLLAYFQLFYFVELSNFIMPYIKARKKTIISYSICGLTLILLSRYYINFINNDVFDASKFGKNYMGDIRYVPYNSIFDSQPDRLRLETFSEIPS